MKQSVIRCFAGILALVVFAGCTATRHEIAADPVSQQLQAAPGMKKMVVAVVLEDKRPMTRHIHYGSSNIERPEHYFSNTINLVGYTIDYLSKVRLFKSVAANRTKGCYTLKLIWKSAHLNLNGWIPFVLRFQNHMTIDMVLTAPNGKVLWNYPLDGYVVNTPSSFRSFSTHRCDIFQERVLEEHYPTAFRDMCLKLASRLKK